MQYKQYEFSQKFISWIWLHYANPKASVLTSGIISHNFDLCRGTAQGDSLSLFLFALAFGTVAAAICKAHDFLGIQIGETAHKIMLYADDILIFVLQPVLFDIIGSLSRLSGYRVSWTKSEALPLTTYCPELFI